MMISYLPILCSFIYLAFFAQYCIELVSYEVLASLFPNRGPLVIEVLSISLLKSITADRSIISGFEKTVFVVQKLPCWR